jgi:hypothetical protein
MIQNWKIYFINNNEKEYYQLFDLQGKITAGPRTYVYPDYIIEQPKYRFTTEQWLNGEFPPN